MVSKQKEGDSVVKRIYAEPDEQTLEEIGKAAEEKGITRHKLILDLIRDDLLPTSLVNSQVESPL